MKPRHTFRASGIETLEDRQLLSHAGALNMLPHPPAHGGHAHVRAHAHRIRAAVMPTTAGAVGASGSANTGTVPAAPTDAQPAGVQTQVTSPVITRGLSQSQAAAWSDRRYASAPVRIAAASMTPDGPRNSDPLSPRTVRTTSADSSAAAAATDQASTPSLPSTSTTATATAPASTAAPDPKGTWAPSTAPRAAAAWMPRAAGADASLAPDHGLSAQHPAFSPLNGRTLSRADVAALKTTADTFAANYTGGQDKARDAVAVTAFKAGLHDLALGVWSDTHVATAAATGQLKTATDAFAQAYTAGAKPDADRAAWKDYLTAVDTFTRSLTDPAAVKADSTVKADPAVKADPPMHAGPGAFRLMPMAGRGPGLSMFSDATESGTAFTLDEAVKLGSVVDDFAASYTSGADRTKDADAEKALQTGLTGLVDAHGKNGVDPDLAPGDPAAVKPAQAGAPGGPLHMMRPMNTAPSTTPTAAPNVKA